MKSVKILMALAAVFILILPALSMPEYGVGQDDRQKICDCQKQKPLLGQEEDQKFMGFGQDGKQKHCKSMMPCMEKEEKKACDCQKPCGCPKSMMGDGDKQSWNGQDDKWNWQGDDGKQINKCDDKAKPCDCQKSMMEPKCDGMAHKQIKSMMGQKCDGMAHKHPKSMMGDKGDDASIKIIVINVK